MATTLALIAWTFAAAADTTAVAVPPAVPQAGAPAWVGYALADMLGSELVLTKKVNVYGWRQVLAASRSARVEPSALADPEPRSAVAAQLGTDTFWTASYEVKGDALTVAWKVGKTSKSKSFALEKIPTAARELAADVAKAATGRRAKKTKGAVPAASRTSLRAFGEALLLLREQSLDPKSQPILDAEQLRAVHAKLAEASTFAPAQVERATVSAMLGEIDRARAELGEVATRGPAADPRFALGSYYVAFRGGERDDALAALKAVTKKYPQFFHGLGYLGRAYARLGDYANGLAVFDTYKKRAPKNPWVALMRAVMLSRNGDHKGALEATREVLKRSPSAMAYGALAARLIDAESYEECRKSLDEGLSKYPDHPLLLTRMSYLELEEGGKERALELAKKAVDQLGAGRGETLAGYAYFNLGYALSRVGKKAESREALARSRRYGEEADEFIWVASQRTVRGQMLGGP